MKAVFLETSAKENQNVTDIFTSAITEMEKEDFLFAQKSIRILSGLYGIIKPLDLIQPYRLEMGTQIKIGKHNDLYEFWGDDITNAINKDKNNDYLRKLTFK